MGICGVFILILGGVSDTAERPRSYCETMYRQVSLTSEFKFRLTLNSTAPGFELSADFVHALPVKWIGAE